MDVCQVEGVLFGNDIGVLCHRLFRRLLLLDPYYEVIVLGGAVCGDIHWLLGTALLSVRTTLGILLMFVRFLLASPFDRALGRRFVHWHWRFVVSF